MTAASFYVQWGWAIRLGVHSGRTKGDWREPWMTRDTHFSAGFWKDVLISTIYESYVEQNIIIHVWWHTTLYLYNKRNHIHMTHEVAGSLLMLQSSGFKPAYTDRAIKTFWYACALQKMSLTHRVTYLVVAESTAWKCVTTARLQFQWNNLR